MTVKVSSLANGLTIISDEMPHLETLSLGMWVNAGARHDSDREHGLSHLLEHMAFKGTKRRTARQIASEVEAVGGDLNAATGFEATAYFARMLKEDLALGIDIFADILQNSVFDRAELAREQNVIIQEIYAANDTPDDWVFELFQEIAFPDQSLGRSILGTEEAVRGFGPSDLRRALAKYSADRMVLAAAGAVSHDALHELAERNLSEFSFGPSVEEQPAHYVGGAVEDGRALEQTHLVLGVEGVSYHDPDYYTAQVLSGIIGGGMSSRLFQQVREQRGLCYSIYSFHWSFKDSGIFGVYSGTGEQQLAELAPVVLEVLRESAENIGAEETAIAQAQLKAGLLMSLESSAARAEQLARQQILFGRIISTEELLAEIARITPAEVRRVAHRLFADARLSVAAVGPTASLPRYDQLSAMLT